MRLKKLSLNIVSAIIFRIVTVVCGIILPRLILQRYGSDVNGLAVSIEQFLAVIVFMELGVGSVVQSCLYKPLAQKDNEEVSKIVASASKFFKKIAVILLIYVLGLIYIFPFMINNKFSRPYTSFLILVISISFFSEYYIGMVDRLLMAADQKGYILYTFQSLAQILNTMVSAWLIKKGVSIHSVKLTYSVIFLFRVLAWRFYVSRHYDIDRQIRYEGEPVRQKRNGMAQHISEVVLKTTDHVVLTLFSTISNVSVYSVYQMLVSGLEQLFLAMTNEIKSLLGELWAKEEKDKLLETFGLTEWGIHTSIVYIFGVAGIMIIPFVSIYTKGITDVVYIQPVFALLIVAAYAGHCFRFPYQIMIFVAGHYRQTQFNYIITAGLNIVLSIIFVRKFDLTGVAFGTFAAALFHTLWMIRYVTHNLIEWPILKVIKQFVVDVFTVAAGFLITKWNGVSVVECVTWSAWVLMGIKVSFLWLVTIIPINLVFYRKNIRKIIYKFIG